MIGSDCGDFASTLLYALFCQVCRPRLLLQPPLLERELAILYVPCSGIIRAPLPGAIECQVCRPRLLLQPPLLEREYQTTQIVEGSARLLTVAQGGTQTRRQDLRLSVRNL